MGMLRNGAERRGRQFWGVELRSRAVITGNILPSHRRILENVLQDGSFPSEEFQGVTE